MIKVGDTWVRQKSLVTVDELFTLGAKIREADKPKPLHETVWWDHSKDKNYNRQVQMLRSLDPAFVHGIENLSFNHLNEIYQFILQWYRWQKKNKQQADEHCWIDHVVGVRASKLALIIQALELFQLEDDEIIKDIAFKHIELIEKDDFIKHNNHGIYDLHGLKLLISSLPVNWMDREEKSKLYDFINNLFSKIWEKQISSNGLHTENSPHYHEVATFLLNKCLKSKLYEDTTVLYNVAKGLENTKHLQYYNDGRLLPFGDTDMAPKKSGISSNSQNERMNVHELDGRVLVTYEFQNSPCTLAVNSSYYSRTHKHCDCQSIVWSEHKDILIDGGKLHYDKNVARDYITSHLAHNVLTTKSGMGVSKPRYIYGNGIVSAESLDEGVLIVSRIPSAYGSETQCRVVFFSVEYGLLVIDFVKLTESCELYSNWILHDDCNIERIELCNGQSNFSKFEVRYNGEKEASFYFFEKHLLENEIVSNKATNDKESCYFLEKIGEKFRYSGCYSPRYGALKEGNFITSHYLFGDIRYFVKYAAFSREPDVFKVELSTESDYISATLNGRVVFTKQGLRSLFD